MKLRPYPEYKDSDVLWLGGIPRHWQALPNRALFDEVNDRNHPEEPLLSVTIGKGVIRQTDLLANTSKKDSSNENKANYKLVQPRDIAYNKMRAWQGAVGVSNYHGIVSPAYIVVRLRRDQNPEYFHYLLRTPAFAKEAERWSYGITSDQWSLRAEDFKQIYCALPPKEEQDAIVAFLAYSDGLINRFIRAKQWLIKLLNEQKQAIVHRVVTRGLDPNVRLKPSGIDWLGDVPEHWEIKRLRRVSPSITVGVVVNPSSYFADDGIPILLGNNVLPGRFRLDDVRRISDESNRILAKSRMSEGDIVVVRVGAPGVAAVIPAALDGCNCASMMIVRQASTFVSEWLMHLFNSPILRSQIDMVKYGAAQKQFNISHAVNFWCPVPPATEQRQMVTFLMAELHDLERGMSNTQSSIDLLREYRTRLITDVVTGKLDVRGVELPALDEAEALQDWVTDEDAQADEMDEIEGVAV